MVKRVIRFVIPFTVAPKQADRQRVVQGKGRKAFALHYQPKAVKENLRRIEIAAMQHRPDRPWEGPVALDLVFHYPYRKSETKGETTFRYVAHLDAITLT